MEAEVRAPALWWALTVLSHLPFCLGPACPSPACRTVRKWTACPAPTPLEPWAGQRVRPATFPGFALASCFRPAEAPCAPPPLRGPEGLGWLQSRLPSAACLRLPLLPQSPVVLERKGSGHPRTY